jgi:hypothetical protein
MSEAVVLGVYDLSGVKAPPSIAYLLENLLFYYYGVERLVL